MRRQILVWPVVISVSALAAGLVNFAMPGMAGRAIVVMWFLFVCPGMALVRFFRLFEPVAEWTLAIALSLALDAMVAGVQLYLGRWSPPVTLEILIAFCLSAAAIQIACPKFVAR